MRFHARLRDEYQRRGGSWSEWMAITGGLIALGFVFLYG